MVECAKDVYKYMHSNVFGISICGICEIDDWPAIQLFSGIEKLSKLLNCEIKEKQRADSIYQYESYFIYKDTKFYQLSLEGIHAYA
jgi:hypothetical protein